MRIGESSRLATGVSAADKQRKARREEAMGEGRGAGQTAAKRYGGPSWLGTDIHSQYCTQMEFSWDERTKRTALPM